MVPLPERARPMASDRQFMEFAVYIPAQDPQLGHTDFSTSLSPFSSKSPALKAPTASKADDRESSFSLFFPASMGPPDTKIVGRLSLRAPIIMPGTILSQF